MHFINIRRLNNWIYNAIFFEFAAISYEITEKIIASSRKNYYYKKKTTIFNKFKH